MPHLFLRIRSARVARGAARGSQIPCIVARHRGMLKLMVTVRVPAIRVAGYARRHLAGVAQVRRVAECPLEEEAWPHAW